MKLIVNGAEQEIQGPITLAEYLSSLGLVGRYVAVARNGEVLERQAFAELLLEEGDRLEIVRPVGGGAQ